jgi:hypothetical protein
MLPGVADEKDRQRSMDAGGEHIENVEGERKRSVESGKRGKSMHECIPSVLRQGAVLFLILAGRKLQTIANKHVAYQDTASHTLSPYSPQHALPFST